ncbi:MAG: cadherin-like beta sandwich domain-containing protein [Gammaproteobacteria bacterium]|nr:cadherin-like beta sandwich domain-containing protein [Gammaproteobacteria bacterium]MDA8023268.1 cadherin-like beta sandwich domain-containing protein [Gammaproteobacteria bacterium]
MHKLHKLMAAFHLIPAALRRAALAAVLCAAWAPAAAQPSNDATLSALSVSGGGAELVSAFSAATRTYAASVANTVDAVLVTPTASDAGATITVNFAAVASGAEHSVSLDFGANEILLVVTAADETTKGTYTLNIERAPLVITVASAAVTYLEGSNRFNSANVFVRAQPPPTNETTVILNTADGSARNRVDYTGGNFTLVFIRGAGQIGVPISVPNDGLVEADKDFTATVSKPPGNTEAYVIGSPATATVTIQDDDRGKARVAFGADAAATAAVAQTAGEADGTRTFQVSISHSAETAVSFTVERDPASAASANDYTLTTNTVTFPANASAAQRTQNLEVSIQNDADAEPNELLVLRIAAADPSAPGLAKHYTRGNTARLTIANDDGLSAPVLAAVSGDSAGTTPGIAYTLAAAVESATTYSASYKKLSPGAPDADFTAAAAIPAAEGADNLAFSVRGLDAASVYELRVRAVDSAANSSDPVSAVARTPSADCVAADTSPCPPSAPRLLLLTPRQGAIAATWAAPAYAGDGSSGADFSAAPQINGYEITHQRAGGGEAQVARADATALVETIGGLEPFEYTVRVRAQNDARGAAAATGAAAEAAATPQVVPLAWPATTVHRLPSDRVADIPLVSVTGGVPPLSYAMSGLPAGLNWRNTQRAPRPGVTVDGTPPGERSNIDDHAVTLDVTDSAQPPNTARFPFRIIIEDARPPRIVLREGARGLGLLGADWTDPGADCLDNFDETKDATANVANVDKDTAGDYTVTYTCADAAGNNAPAVTRAVKIRAFSLDVNDDGGVDKADAILIARHLLGVRGEALAAGQANLPGANMSAFIAGGSFNVDGNTDAGNEWWDGVLLLRYLLGLRGADLIAEHPDAAALNADTVAAAIAALLAQ